MVQQSSDSQTEKNIIETTTINASKMDWRYIFFNIFFLLYSGWYLLLGFRYGWN